MVRLRTEKPKPNRIGVVLDDIKAIRENIDIADLTGNSIKLAFKYHNRIKQLLISKLVKQDAYVLEVGLGRFGDMAKYEAAKVGGIYGVEPNTENIKEAKSRIKNNKYMKDRVQIIKAGGEDSDLIVEEVGSEADPKDRVDVVSLMLSLSFFYKSEKLLDGLVETIARTLSPNGKIIFMTIDGDAVNELAHSTIRTELAPKKKVMFGDDNYIVLPDQKSREVEIKLSGTILADVEGEQVEGKQTEWLVILGVFTAKLRKHGFILKEVYQADGEKLLSEDAQKFSRLYCYGYYERDNSGIKYLKGKEEKPKVEKKEKKTKERKEEWTVVSEYDGEVLEKWNDQYVLFGGLSTASKAGRLSILDLAYPIQFSTTETFNVDGNEEMDYKWLNVSQYIEATKADTFKDRTVFDAILSEKRPKNYHILARKIKRYDPDIWGDIEQSVVSRAIKHKFGVKEAREHLVDTGERQIVYTHPYDLQYGAGVSIDGFTTDYPGANYLGDILMTRREKLLRGMSKSD